MEMQVPSKTDTPWCCPHRIPFLLYPFPSYNLSWHLPLSLLNGSFLEQIVPLSLAICFRVLKIVFPEKLCDKTAAHFLVWNIKFRWAEEVHTSHQELKHTISSNSTIPHDAFPRREFIFIDSHRVFKHTPRNVFIWSQYTFFTDNGQSSN